MEQEPETADSEGKPDFVGIGDPGTMIVQKTEPLRTMTQSMSLSQLKLLDIYLGRINSYDPEHRWVRIERDEIASAFGIKRTTLDMLRNLVQGFLKPLEFVDPVDPRNMIMIVPFDMARLYCDKYGVWQIDLRASEAGMEYIFHPDRIGYLKYRLHNVLKLQYKHSYLMYLYIESKRLLCDSWIVSVNELKSILMCSSEYPEYKQFNAKILKKVQSDILSNTTTKYKYEPVRRGRWIVQLRITLLDSNGKDESQPHVIDAQTDAPKQLSKPAEDLDDDDYCDYDKEDTLTNFLLSALCPSRGAECEFTSAQIREIRHILLMIPDDRLPHPHNDENSGYEDEDRRADFAESCYLKMLSKAEELKKANKPIKNRYRYFLSMLRKNGGLS